MPQPALFTTPAAPPDVAPTLLAPPDKLAFPPLFPTSATPPVLVELLPPAPEPDCIPPAAPVVPPLAAPAAVSFEPQPIDAAAMMSTTLAWTNSRFMLFSP